jgi:hypothetical protein
MEVILKLPHLRYLGDQSAQAIALVALLFS